MNATYYNMGEDQSNDNNATLLTFSKSNKMYGNPVPAAMVSPPLLLPAVA